MTHNQYLQQLASLAARYAVERDPRNPQRDALYGDIAWAEMKLLEHDPEAPPLGAEQRALFCDAYRRAVDVACKKTS
jgi:hypothetical protein